MADPAAPPIVQTCRENAALDHRPLARSPGCRRCRRRQLEWPWLLPYVQFQPHTAMRASLAIRVTIWRGRRAITVPSVSTAATAFGWRDLTHTARRPLPPAPSPER